jgi:O-antigen/teichoic acid export membrane protein
LSEPSEQTDDKRLSAEAAADVRIIAKGGAVQTLGQISQRGLSFFFTAIAIRVLGAPGYGLYRLVAQILANLGQFALAGFNYSAMRFIARARAARRPEGVKGAARVALVGSGIASAVVVAALLLATEPVAGFFSDPRRADDLMIDLLRVGAVYIPLFALLQVLRYCTQAYKTMVPSVLAGNVVQPLARFVLGVGALVAGYAVMGLVVTLIASVGLAAVVAGVFLARMLSEAERGVKGREPPGPMIRFGLLQMGASILGIKTLGLGILMLGWLQDDLQVGLFAAALALQGPANVFLGGIINIWAPVVSDLYEKGAIDRLGSLYQTINRWVVTFSFPVLAVLIIEPELLVRLFAGREGIGAASVVAVLAIGNFFYTGTGPTGYLISMTGRPGVNFANSAVSVALFVALGAIVVPEHGALGMAVVDSVVTALVNIARVIQGKILVGIQPFGRTFYKPVVATAVGAAVLLALKLLPWTGTAVGIGRVALAGIVYVFVLRWLELDPEEQYVLDRIKARIWGRSTLK